MSNKPKNAKRIVNYVPNKGERRHIALVNEARKQDYKNPGSKSLHTLKRIIPMKFVNRLKDMLNLNGSL